MNQFAYIYFFILGHINNLYNTCFWALVHSGKTETEAENILRVM